jgi:hypothetical protein
VDGFAAGPEQRLDRRVCEDYGDAVHRWTFTRREQNAAEIQAILAARANVIGRNMFRSGPRRLGRDLDGVVGPRDAGARPVSLRSWPARSPAPLALQARQIGPRIVMIVSAR